MALRPAINALDVRSRKLSNFCKDIGYRMDNKYLLSRAPSCFGRYFNLLVPAAFTVVKTDHLHWASVVGYCPVSLYVIHKEELCLSSEDINRLMIKYIPLTLDPRRGLRYSFETPTFNQNDLAMRNTADVTGGKSIAV
jgi:hypothetical protein